MLTKYNELLRCDNDFLSILSKEVNFSYRNYNSVDKEYLVTLLSDKFNRETIKEIVDLYMLCYDVEDISNIVKPDSVGKITNSIKQFFGQGHYLYEVRLGKRICDLVILTNNEIIAIEIKSARDKVVSAIEQMNYYQSWSNKVYLVYDEAHRKRINNIQNTKYGLLEYSHGVLKEIQKPQFNALTKDAVLKFISYKYIKKLASYYGIKKSIKKDDIIKELYRKISNKSIQPLFINYLENK